MLIHVWPLTRPKKNRERAWYMLACDWQWMMSRWTSLYVMWTSLYVRVASYRGITSNTESQSQWAGTWWYYSTMSYYFRQTAIPRNYASVSTELNVWSSWHCRVMLGLCEVVWHRRVVSHAYMYHLPLYTDSRTLCCWWFRDRVLLERIAIST